ncbi:MAG: methyltransferase domain-containing protein [Dehalococcoidia bacterium]
MTDLADLARRVRRAGVRAVTDPSYRAILRARLTRGGALHQTTELTWRDRYPEIFGACRALIGDSERHHLLSFGCSTGEEVLSLREYFPSARITGAEINTHSLEVCRRLQVDERIAFVRSESRILESCAPFDAIFAMAVLQRTPHRVEGLGLTSLRRIYPFERFQAQLTEFDRWLAPGGLLVIHHTQYVFGHTVEAERYLPVGGESLAVVDGLKFDRRSTLIPGPVAVPTVYRRQRA